jgi:predicted dehydrogenase
MHREPEQLTRRTFVRATTAAAAVGTLAAPSLLRASNDADAIKVGLIGCGGRGTGAAHNAIDADPRIRVVSLADLFPDRLESSRAALAKNHPAAGTVDPDRCFSGWDAYKEVVAQSDLDYVILATPPHFRPAHFEAAVAAGKNVFMEKPVAVDPAGIRKVLAAADAAKANSQSVVAGTQRRHSRCYLDAMDRVHGGDIGEIICGRCYWNMGGLWNKGRDEAWSDMEWQLRNWLYFTWLSGDHIVEQHVHNLDVMNWAIGATPLKAVGLGGRQARTSPEYGHIFDHFAIEFVYPGDVHVTSMCRQQDNTASRVAEAVVGTTGVLHSHSGRTRIDGAHAWKSEGQNPNPYVQEHADLVASITGDGEYLNEGRRIAESTATAIMGRLACYTGQEITWDALMNSTLDLTPPQYAFGDLAVAEVPVPGQTKMV